ncbi:hypothetical protein PINS_up011236 [Pythium insidiosum]|nr:hypothetical protein PINS_up011236 [Pythium insidiosum]
MSTYWPITEAKRTVFRATDDAVKERVRQCVRFLQRVRHIERDSRSPSDDKHALRLRVSLEDGDDDRAGFTIDRTMDEIKQLHRMVVYWSSKHDTLHASYGVPPCEFCAQFNTKAARNAWPHGLKKLLLSTDARDELLQRRLNELVHQATLFETLVQRQDVRCDGMEHVPSVVVTFLLKDVDQSALS